MQQRSGKHYLQAKREYIDTGKLGKITLARTWWHGNSYHLRKAPASPAEQAFQSGLGALPGPGEVARLRSAAVLQLARLSRFRRRPGDRPVHALDRRGPHVHGQGHSELGAWPPAASTTTRTAAPRRTPSTCCWNTRASSPRPSRPRSRPASPARRSRSAAPRAGSGSTAAATSSPRWAANAQPIVVQGVDGDIDHATTSTTSWSACSRRKLPNGDVLIGHRSAQASHLGNIAYMQKRRIDFDPVREEILPF